MSNVLTKSIRRGLEETVAYVRGAADVRKYRVHAAKHPSPSRLTAGPSLSPLRGRGSKTPR
jgi:hypothetical protein